ncbi:MAG TPA: class I SAM-dependent methyltransferase [Streptosporangiaceae bacterium]|jgi:SAM-dependent methyltransferase
MADRAGRAMSFGAIAADYDRLRPAPPAEAADWLLPRPCETAVDLAAGTGLLTRLLAGRARQVIAVEPDQRMAAVLRAHSPGARVLAGTGEAIPLPDASADAVLVSSAWHWLDPDQAVPEIARVLRDGGRLGLIWTSRDRQVSWVRELGRLARGPGQPGHSPGPDQAAPDDAGQEAERASRGLAGRREIRLPEPGPFTSVSTASFAFSKPMTVEDIVGMLGTYSGVITASPRDRAAGLARGKAALRARFPGAGLIDVPMRSWCWRADRVSRDHDIDR